ncbi:MAG: hypothetical protein RIC35_22870 [Marinoscillum sp.]
MNIVEKEAEQFSKRFYEGGTRNTLSTLKDRLTSKLYDFNRDRDKLDFLKTVRTRTKEQLDGHNCGKSSCAFEEDRNTGLFVIDQEISDIKKYYAYEPQDEDAFSEPSESELHNKLNTILAELQKQGLGQEILFEEIESLKNHFNLGKKTWFQLLKGKLIDLMVDQVLEKTIANDIYSSLSEGYEQIVKQLNV